MGSRRRLRDPGTRGELAVLRRSRDHLPGVTIIGGIGDRRTADPGVSCIRNADDVDYDELFTQFYPVLHRYTFRLTGDVDEADDVAQESFVRMIRRSVSGEPPALRSWLFRTALNLVRDRSRVRTNRERLLEENPEAVPTQDEPARPDRNAIRSEDVRRVRKVLESLPERDRVILVMREEGFKYDEIADEVGVAPGSVGTLLARAQERFAQAYRDERAESDASDDR